LIALFKHKIAKKPKTSAVSLQHYEKAGQHHQQMQVRKVTTSRFPKYIALWVLCYYVQNIIADQDIPDRRKYKIT
jgi:hypothetical protein